MTSKPGDSHPSSIPYVGLVPYREEDAEYFCGRTRDLETVATNLRAARLTVFYGASGVGKSSLINAGVIPYLKKILTRQSALLNDPPAFIPVVMRDWANHPLTALNLKIAEAVTEAFNAGLFPEKTDPPAENFGSPEGRFIDGPEQKAQNTKLPARHINERSGITIEKINALKRNNHTAVDMVAMLKSWTGLTKTTLLIILDQFEDFFICPKYADGPASFACEFPKAVNTVGLRVNFMVSLRDDALSKLDFFKGRIPDLTRNTLRLLHLDKASAEEAIRGPVEKFNELNSESFEIEDELVTKLLEDLQVDKVKFETQGQANLENVQLPGNNPSESEGEYKVETPYLQLVMVRLWESRITQDTKQLALSTLTEKENLGGVQEIVRTYLDKVINEFSPSDRELLSEFIHFTVTRTGTKISSSAAGLAEWAQKKLRKDDIERILTSLSSGQNRIFRTVENLKDPEDKYYEVSHDALAPAILSWRKRYLDRVDSSKFEKIKRFTWMVAPPVLLVLLGAFGAGLYLAYDQGAYFSAVNANITTKDNLQISAKAQTLSDEQLAAMLSILGDLQNASPTQKKDAFEKLDDLNSSSHVSDKIKAALLDLTTKSLDDESVNELKAILSKSPEVGPRRVHIHIPDPSQEAWARNLKAILEKNSFVVPGIETVSRINLNNTQVRYFREDDQELAKQVMDLLAKYSVPNVKIQFFPGYEDSPAVRPNQVEVWFANDIPVKARIARTGDGYVSLRSSPEVDEANEIVRIPGGTEVVRLSCQRPRFNLHGRSGRWCQIRLNNQTGWVFEPFLDYF